ncbi:NAD(P)/FAD-dependent oxidoreductase [Methylocella silvestris]|uniref:Aminoacetone oxidase family FAD-binding enzyme n=1 Tax=Methylocella silvestris TaxID=199596 RepID=A0A2J7TMC2_METSI|nr:TIGR03862 family flavoprotein [Methylocella silvestris]PNG27921.1 aminoacetone oxidase family FAD-binding enzyme [Methylocella silvestris]
MPLAARPHVIVIGAGPAGLMAAETVASNGVRVSIYDRMAAPGRKFLLAGRGGLNLTHSEDFEILLSRYGAARDRLRQALELFSPKALRAWCEEMGQATFIGTSGRVFPATFKASPLLRAWLKRLASLGVTMHLRQEWRGWDANGALLFAGPGGETAVEADATILALGGASWPRLGSDGGWVGALERAAIATAPLRPANCGFLANWSDHFKDLFAGEPLKGIAASFGAQRVRGEATITRAGLEGGALYALAAPLRDAIAATGEAALTIALRPDMAEAELERRIASRDPKQSFSTFARKSLRLSPASIGLMQESARAAFAPLGEMSPARLAGFVNAVPIRLTGVAPLARAISTAGGVVFDEVDCDFMLRRRPGAFVAGEMLDWEAPTGGYLMQACFATGAAAGRGALQWAAHEHAAESLGRQDLVLAPPA